MEGGGRGGERVDRKELEESLVMGWRKRSSGILVKHVLRFK